MNDQKLVKDDTTERKRVGELSYWSELKDIEGQFYNGWFERFYTSHFDLTVDDYVDKRVLDIGCGPRGSLEWATMARERVGIDPLAEEYLKLGAADHAMTYVATGAESIPYPDGYFDFVCSVNSLDHVDDLQATIAEIKRVTSVGGLLLLLTDVHDEPTPQEPICFDWDVVGLFAPEFVPQFIRCFEKREGGMYTSAEKGVLYDHADSRRRYGVLSARFSRVTPAQVSDSAVAQSNQRLRSGPGSQRDSETQFGPEAQRGQNPRSGPGAQHGPEPQRSSEPRSGLEAQRYYAIVRRGYETLKVRFERVVPSGLPNVIRRSLGRAVRKARSAADRLTDRRGN